MIRKRFSPPVSSDVREVAADWLLREEAGELDAAGVAVRDAWLAEHPDHVGAYDAVRRSMGRVDGVAADAQIVALRQAALALKPGRRPDGLAIAASAAAAAVILAGGLVGAQLRSPSFATALVEQVAHPTSSIYRTDVGQRSTITLPDGSVATLNTDSVVRVAYSGGARVVRLVRGQALFEVAHGQSRPFQVYAKDRTITALGTVFDVRLTGGAVKVALVEGRVKVRRSADDQGAAQVVLAPGEILQARPALPMQVKTADVARETSWSTGFLVFDQTPLSEAVAELNRYSKDQLIVENPAVGALKVSGAFKTGDLDRFARTAAEILPVTLERRVGGDIVLIPEPETLPASG